jgi:hypothetical protein
MKTAKELEGTHIRLLHHIFRIMVVAGQPTRQVIGGRQMR